MIPVELQISGFLSYRDPVELDFTRFDLACIAGPNGAGKSSLLDAITWALFGQARQRDESVINIQPEVEAAEVIFTFQYEGNLYRVQRSNPRGKTSMLEFHILQNYEPGQPIENGTWKPLTERTLRDTQARIEEILRLDYETFVNASFFLQGKADQFTQQRPGDRKRILGNILGLEVWESYRLRAAERRRGIQGEISKIEGRLQENLAELEQEQARKANLEELEERLDSLSKARAAKEEALESVRKLVATLEEKRRWVDSLAKQIETTDHRLSELKARLEERATERDSHAGLLAREAEIKASYQNWETARAEVERWDQVAAQFREGEKRRQAPLEEINTTAARLEQERLNLQELETGIKAELSKAGELEEQLESARAALAEAEDKLAQREEFDKQLQEARKRQAEARAENPRLKAEMDELKGRIDQLKETEGATCPLCGQPLSPEERHRLIEELTADGTEMGDRFRANKTLLEQADQHVKELERQIAALAQAEVAVRQHSGVVQGLTAHLEQIRDQEKSWLEKDQPRLDEIDQALEQDDFANQARKALAEIDTELKEIGYDAAAHDGARRAEAEGRPAVEELRGLENAQTAIAQLDREIASLEEQIDDLQSDLQESQADHEAALESLKAAEAQTPDLAAAESELLDIQEQENRLLVEVGAAQQKVSVLANIKKHIQEYEAQRDELACRVGQYKQLERAFSKDGVPALLIEQALPQIETKANEILDRLSRGTMSVRFVTQAKYKDTRREDLKETLEIQISDSAGQRDYEMFSGGEAFRVNFAIRLALSEVLSQRAGARLQTLVIDEGFGSQDTQGRQRLVEAINMVRDEFAKILVITHIDELKDAFPNRIEVEKTARGSQLSVF